MAGDEGGALQDSNYFTNGDLGLLCQQVGASGPTGDCEDGLPIKYEGDVLLSKGNKTTNSRLTRLDGNSFQTGNGSNKQGWLDAPFGVVIGGAKSSRNNGVFNIIGYEPGVDANGNTVANATLVFDLSTPLGASGTDTLAVAPTAAKLTFVSANSTATPPGNATVCGRELENSVVLGEGIATVNGTLDGAVFCTVVDDHFTSECSLQALVTQNHSGSFTFPAGDHNFAVCGDGSVPCGQTFHNPDKNPNSGFIKKNLPATDKLCQGCVFGAKFKGHTGISDVAMRFCITPLLPTDQLGSQTIDCGNLQNGEPLSLTEIPVNADNNINPASPQSKMSVNFDNTASVLTQLLLPSTVVFRITSDDGKSIVDVVNDGAPTFNGNSAVFRTFVVDMINCYAAVNGKATVSDGQQIDFAARGRFDDPANPGQPLDAGIYGLTSTMVQNGNADYTAGPCPYPVE